ncbi:hypothetical protein ACWDA3_27750 [Nonomuraea rubra]
MHPGDDVELPDEKQYPFYGKHGYYRSWDARNISPKRREAIEREAESPEPALRPAPTS